MRENSALSLNEIRKQANIILLFGGETVSDITIAISAPDSGIAILLLNWLLLSSERTVLFMSLPSATSAMPYGERLDDKISILCIRSSCRIACNHSVM